MKTTLLLKTILCCCFLLFISCEEIILEDDISAKEITLIAPTNNTEFSTTGVTFNWSIVELAKQYRLQVAKPNFNTPIQIVLDTLVTTNQFTNQFNTGEYEWRVQAVNGNYTTLFKSRFFKISSNSNFENNTLVLNSPANNLITNAVSQNLSWQTVLGATGYQVQILDNSNAIINNQTTTNTSVNFSFPQGNFQWKVRATNGVNETLYSTRNILVDTNVPNTPVLSAPINISTTSNTTVVFQWARTPITGSIERDEIFIYSNSTLTNLVHTAQVTSPFNRILTAGTYYWFVKSFDAAGNMSNQSAVFSFTLN